ncbi:hypothetical protein ACFQY5_34185 [Paeniroseomonas aquatica]|uniref:hypothetical protein n=1 Tax=Paeniroseomonas aquatica TaxID=373043 RepID=UPI00361132E6
MEFRLGCELAYQLQQPTPFLFNVEVARTPIQAIRHEALAFTPALPQEAWLQPESGNRYLRVVAPPGRFVLHYEATVSPRAGSTTPPASPRCRPASCPSRSIRTSIPAAIARRTG